MFHEVTTRGHKRLDSTIERMWKTYENLPSMRVNYSKVLIEKTGLTKPTIFKALKELVNWKMIEECECPECGHVPLYRKHDIKDLFWKRVKEEDERRPWRGHYVDPEISSFDMFQTYLIDTMRVETVDKGRGKVAGKRRAHLTGEERRDRLFEPVETWRKKQRGSKSTSVARG